MGPAPKQKNVQPSKKQKAPRRRSKKSGPMQPNAASTRGKAASVLNPYLATLLDPEHHQFCYPDKFGDETTVARIEYVDAVTVIPDGTGAGDFWFWVNPTLADLMVERLPETAAQHTYTGAVTFPNGWSVPTAFANCVLSPPVGTSQVSGPDTPPGRSLVPDTGVYKLPAMSSPSSMYLTWANADVACQVVFEDGSTAVVNNGGAATGIATTHTTLKYQFKSTSGGNSPLAGFQISLVINEAAGAVDEGVISVDGFAELLGTQEVQPVYTNYRVVAQSVLVSYEGDTLNDGGQIVAAHLGGGESPESLGATDFNAIASLPNSYEGAINKGAYGFWKPACEADMNFRKVKYTNRLSDGALPSMVFAGHLVHATSTVRVKIHMIVEATSEKFYTAKSFSIVAPELILAADKALWGVKRLMENPDHVEAIKRFLSETLRKGSAVAQTIADIARMVGPVLSTASFLLA